MPTATMTATRTAGIYVRLSQDRDGTGLGVERQEQACRDLAERKGWAVAEVYVDNDVSATSGRRRPAYERLWDDVGHGLVDAVVVWSTDRLTRTPRELEDIIDTAERRGVSLATVSGDIDLGTSTGRTIARILGAVARGEVEHKADRQRAANEQAAANGRPWSGGTRGYGYTRDMVVVPEEAAIVREAAGRLLEGETLSAICADLQRRGVTTPAGRAWQPRTLRRLLASARISGRRERFPRDVRNDKGEPVSTRPLLGDIVAEGAWEPIVDPATSDQLRALLSSPQRKTGRPATGAMRRYLLTGVARCGLCGAGLVGQPKDGRPRYRCPKIPGGTACGGIYVSAERLDTHVVARVLAVLAGDALTSVLNRGGDTAAALGEVRDLEAELADLDQAVAAGTMSVKSSITIRAGLQSRIDAAHQRVAQAAGTAAAAGVVGMDAEQLAQVWPTLDATRQRALVRLVVDHVTVNRAEAGGRWTPGRVDITWAA